MKITHICLTGAFTDGLTYQENLLPKYHNILGYKVSVIASQWGWGKNNNLERITQTNYTNQDGVEVFRIATVYGNIISRFKIYKNLYQTIERTNPSVLFIHGCQFLDIFTIIRYLQKHPRVKVYVDNHADFSNSAQGWLSKNILHKIIWRMCARAIEPYTTKFYGVLPARVDFLKDVYKLPAAKCELLVMGADDDMVEQATNPQVRSQTRRQYGIKEDDFLIVSGGKINHNRPETLHLMQAVKNLQDPHVKLLIFGAVATELKTQFDSLCDNKQIIFAGWQQALQTQQIMAAAELIVFPGLHSVMWEQAVALGIPCIFRKLKGFDHVDVGGNAVLLQDVSERGLEKAVSEIIRNQQQYARMKSVAQEKGLKTFSYREIAKRSIEA